MSTDLEKLVVQLSADIRKYERAMARAQGITNKQFSAIERRAQKMNSTLERYGKRTATALIAPLTGISAALSAKEIARYADEWTLANNKIRAAATAAGVQTRSLEALKDGANGARTEFAAYIDLYARLIRSASGVAKSEKEIARATDIVSKAFKAGGASASEQAAGILQLGQALGSGVLQGDELRSIRENAPVLAKAIADEFGTTVAGLKELGEEGKLTSDRIFAGILKAQGDIEAQFQQTRATIADAVGQIENEFIAYVGKADEGAGASAKLVEALQALATNFEDVADVVVDFATLLAGAFAGRALVAAVVGLKNTTAALALFLTALRAGTLTAAGFTAALGPIGLIAGAAAAAIYLFRDRLFGAADAADKFDAAIKANEAALASARNSADGYSSALRNQIAMQLEAAKAAYAEADAYFAAANARRVAFEQATGLRFKPFKLAEDSAAIEADKLGGVVAKLEQQLAEIDKRGASLSGFGKGVAAVASSKGKKTKANDYERTVQQIRERTAALQAETAALKGVDPLVEDYGFKQAQVAAAIDLFTAAQKAGTAAGKELASVQQLLAGDFDGLSPKARAQAEAMLALANDIGTATAESQKLSQAQDDLRQRAEEWRDTSQDATKGFVKDLIAGKSAADALAGALDKIADKLLDMALDGLFSSTGGGLFGSLFSGLFSAKNGGAVPAFANGGAVAEFAPGGRVTGPGGPRGDGILARLSAGEFVVNAEATKRYRDVLEAINSGRVPAYADGGGVPILPRIPTASAMRAAAASSQTVNVSLATTIDARGADGGVEGRLRDVLAENNRNLVKQIPAVVRDAMQRGAIR